MLITKKKLIIKKERLAGQNASFDVDFKKIDRIKNLRSKLKIMKS